MRLLGRKAIAGCIAVALASLSALAPGDLHAAEGAAGQICDRVAGPLGADRNPGTAGLPLLTAQALVNSLEAGETGCLRDGFYGDDQEIKLETPGVTLRSYPNERANLRGRVWVTQDAPGSTLTGLDIDGRNERGLPSPTINGDYVTLSGNEITNHHTSICVSVGSPNTFGRAQGTLIEGNEIYDCGTLPATNYDHGIYVNSADDTTIVGNWIHGNADRGIQLYPDAQRTFIGGNTITGNGQGVLFGGGEATASSGNIVVGNVIAGSTIRGNVESSWGGPIGSGNYVVANCISGGVNEEGNAGSGVGFTGAGNVATEETGLPCGAPTP